MIGERDPGPSLAPVFFARPSRPLRVTAVPTPPQPRADERAPKAADLTVLRRDVRDCREELDALKDILAEHGLFTAQGFAARVHRRRFAATWATHGFEPTAAHDVLRDQDVARYVGANAGVRATRVARATSRGLDSAFHAALLYFFSRTAIYICGGHDGRGALCTAEGFNPNRGHWAPLAPMAQRRGGAGAGVLLGDIYVCGGFNGQDAPVASVERFSPQAGTWSAVPPMRVARGGVAAAVHDRHLYVVGGRDAKREVLAVAERLDPATQSWEFVSSLRTARHLPVAGCTTRWLFICGGHSVSSEPLRSVERLDPASLAWHSAPSMHERRAGAAIASLDGRVYVCGGYSGKVDLSSAECFSEATGTWTRIAPMTIARCGACASVSVAAAPGSICIFGGVDGERTLSCAEKFDPRTNAWAPLLSLTGCRESAAAVTAGWFREAT